MWESATQIDIRIGLATGNIIAGNIGTEKTRTFSIIGDPLTLSEELEQTNKNYGTYTLVTEQTKDLAGEEFLFRFAGILRHTK